MKIALVIKTDGLEYDDRVRKEILTIEQLYPNIKFKIYVILPDNKDVEGITSYGVPYHSVYLKSRNKFPSSKKLMQKAFEFYWVIRKDLRDYDAVWCADRGSFMTVALCGSKHLLWDLHELPMEMMGGTIKKWLLRFLFFRCKVVLHANPQRMEYLCQKGYILNRAKHFALRNYPNFEDIDSEYDENYKSFIEWKGTSRCIYLQGLSEERRAGYETIAAVMRIEDIKAVVVGKMYQESKDKLIAEFGEDALNKRIHFVGKVAQLKIPQYMSQCDLSLIFYKNVSPNNWYCEANRFYQSVIMGLPVVVGANPPMKELIDRYGFGVCIDDDGSNVNKIVAGLEEVLANYEQYKINNKKFGKELFWNKQYDAIKGIIEKLFA